MKRAFITNIDEANNQLLAVDADLVTAKETISTVTARAEKAEKDATDATAKVTASETRATTAEGLVEAKDKEILKLKADLTAANSKTVETNAAPGVPAVTGATPDAKKPTDGLTGRARTMAAFENAQPRSNKGAK